MISKWVAVMVAGGVCALLAGCKPKVSRAPSSPVVAQVGGRSITRADFEAEAARRRDTGDPATSPRALLDQMIEREAMLVKAASSDIAKSEAFKRDTESRLLSQWVASTMAKARDNVTVTEAELKQAYESGKKSTFTTPGVTRLAILYRKLSGHKGDDEARELETKLEEGVAAFENDRASATNNGRLPGFGKIAANYSEDTVTRYRGGDLGWLNLEQGQHPRVPKEVLAAGAALQEGKASAPVRAGDGVYIVMKDGERSAKQMSYEEAVPLLRRKLIRAKQRDIEARFKTDILASVPVTVSSDEAGKLALPKGKVRTAGVKADRAIPTGPEQ